MRTTQQCGSRRHKPAAYYIIILVLRPASYARTANVGIYYTYNIKNIIR